MAVSYENSKLVFEGIKATGITSVSALPETWLLHGAGKFGLASLANLDALPPKGTLLIAPPLKIVNGSGSPLRVLALVPG